MGPTHSSDPNSPDLPQRRPSTPDENAPPAASPEAGSSQEAPHGAFSLAHVAQAALNRQAIQQQRQEAMDVLDNLVARPSVVGAESERGEDDREAATLFSNKPHRTEEMSEKARGKLPVRNPSTPPPGTPHVDPVNHSNAAGANDFGLTAEDWEQHGEIIQGMVDKEGFSEDAVKLWIETVKQRGRARWGRGVDPDEDGPEDEGGTDGDHGEPGFDEDDIRRAVEASRHTNTHEPERGSSAGPSGTDSKTGSKDDSEYGTSRLKRSRLTTEGMSEKAKGKLPVRDPPTLERSDAALGTPGNVSGDDSLGSSELTDEQQAAIAAARQGFKDLFQEMRRSGYSQEIMANSIRRNMASWFGVKNQGAGTEEAGASNWATDEHGFSEEQIRRAKQLSLEFEEIESGAGPSGTHAPTDHVPAGHVADNLVDEGEDEAEVPHDFVYYSE